MSRALKRVEALLAKWHESADAHVVYSLINDSDRILFDSGFSQADLRAVLALAKMADERATPSIATKEQIKFAGDVLSRHAAGMQANGARHADHYALNQLAHWLWRLAGAARKPLPRRRGARRR